MGGGITAERLVTAAAWSGAAARQRNTAGRRRWSRARETTVWRSALSLGTAAEAQGGGWWEEEEGARGN